MRFLFVHQNFPGQYLHLLRYLAAARQHEILFLTDDNQNTISGVRKLVYRLGREPSKDAHRNLREIEPAMIRAEAVAQAAKQLQGLGFRPDIIIGHHGWGEMLDLCDVWPDVPMLGYFEFFYHTDGLDVGFDPEFPVAPAMLSNIRVKNTINLLALQLPGHGQTPTRFQHQTYPDWARPRISIIREGADLDLCQPDSDAAKTPFLIDGITVAPEEKLITFVARDLEPYRGYHIMMRALPHLFRARRDLRVILVGGDGVSYGAKLANDSWRNYFQNEVKGRFDESRVHFPGRIDYRDYRRLLQRSDAHVYLTYPFVASWSLREALASGCAVIGSDTGPVREFITDGENGLLAPFLEPERVAERVLTVLEDRALSARLRVNARRYAERHLAMADYIDAMAGLIERLAGTRPETALPRPAKTQAPPPTESGRRAPSSRRKSSSSAATRSKPKLGSG